MQQRHSGFERCGHPRLQIVKGAGHGKEIWIFVLLEARAWRFSGEGEALPTAGHTIDEIGSPEEDWPRSRLLSYARIASGSVHNSGRNRLCLALDDGCLAQTRTGVMYCTRCGTKAGGADVFCMKCGSRLKLATSERGAVSDYPGNPGASGRR